MQPHEPDALLAAYFMGAADKAELERKIDAQQARIAALEACLDDASGALFQAAAALQIIADSKREDAIVKRGFADKASVCRAMVTRARALLAGKEAGDDTTD